MVGTILLCYAFLTLYIRLFYNKLGNPSHLPLAQPAWASLLLYFGQSFHKFISQILKHLFYAWPDSRL